MGPKVTLPDGRTDNGFKGVRYHDPDLDPELDNDSESSSLQVTTSLSDPKIFRTIDTILQLRPRIPPTISHILKLGT